MRQNGYSFNRKPMWSGFSMTRIVKRIILINVAAFILQNLISPQFTVLLSLTPQDVVEKFMIWQVITYMFLHFDLTHLLFNMFIVWMFGSTLESIWGERRFLNYYITCGLGGALASFIFAYNSLTLGASAAGFGLLLAYAMMFPNNYIYIWFLLPVKAKYLMLFLVVMQLVLGLAGPSGVAFFAHLGGMGAGLLFFKKEISFTSYFSTLFSKGRSAYSSMQPDRDKQERSKVDSILDKINKKGYENLSDTEKRILENYSKKRKNENN